MELVLALLLAAALVLLASTWSALRTERARLRRLEERLAARPERVRSSAEPLSGPEPGRPWREDEEPAVPPAEPHRPLPPPETTPGDAVERLAAALVAPAERLAECVEASGPALAAAANHLRTPLPPAAPVPEPEEVAPLPPADGSAERALATAERLSDERSRLADDVRSLRASLERVAVLDGGLGHGLAQLSRTADELAPLAASISGLADRANLLGLNISILANRAGGTEAPFEEAAAELRGLFEEARRLSRELSEAARRNDAGARRVAAFVEESAGTATAAAERGARAAERLGALEGLCGQLERSLSEAVRGARTASETGEFLSRRLEAAGAALAARGSEANSLRADAEAARAALRAAAERIEALRLDGGALRAAVVRVTTSA
ncbi:MAG: hypothetical protein U0529_02760 [Thermoanaerobaculia bacterium]